MVHDYIKDEVRRRFTDRAGFTIVERRQLFLLAVGTDILLRFKKLDEDGRARNYPTQQARDFDCQLPLEGIPDAERVNVGYVLDPLGLQISVVMLSKTNGSGRVEWHRIIDPDAWAIVDYAPVLPLHQPAAAGNPPARRVRAKPELVADVNRAHAAATQDGEHEDKSAVVDLSEFRAALRTIIDGDDDDGHNE